MPMLASAALLSAFGMASNPLPRHPTVGIEGVGEGAIGAIPGRLPDAAGLGSWTPRVQGTGAEAIANLFIDGPVLMPKLRAETANACMHDVFLLLFRIVGERTRKSRC